MTSQSTGLLGKLKKRRQSAHPPLYAFCGCKCIGDAPIMKKKRRNKVLFSNAVPEGKDPAGYEFITPLSVTELIFQLG